MEELGTIIQSCVLKESMVKSPFISLINAQPTSWLTLNGHLNWHSVNTHLTLNRHLYCTCLTLHRQLIDSQLSVDQLICIDQFDTQWHDCKNELTLHRLLTKMFFKCQASVNWGVNQISIECQSRVSISTQLWMSLVHMWFG